MIAQFTPSPYLNELYRDYTIEHKPFKGHPNSGRDQMGYGKKIPTDWIVGVNNRWYRIYVACYSNVGTAYIKTKEHPFVIVRDSDIPTILKSEQEEMPLTTNN